MAGLHVHRQRFLGLLEGNGQRIGAQFGHLHQFIVDHDPERPSQLLGKRQERDPVTDAVGMVGDHHDRSLGKIARRPLAGHRKLDIDHVQHLAEDPIRLAVDVVTPNIVETRVAVAAGEVFNRADEPALQTWIPLVGIGKFLKLHQISGCFGFV